MAFTLVKNWTDRESELGSVTEWSKRGGELGSVTEWDDREGTNEIIPRWRDRGVVSIQTGMAIGLLLALTYTLEA